MEFSIFIIYRKMMSIRTGLLFFLFLLLTNLPLWSQKPLVFVTDSGLTSGNHYWSRDTIYLLDGIVKLTSGSLNIEHGTLIQAKINPSDGSPYSALIIGSQADLKAQGDYFDPIIFTIESDDPQDPSDLEHEIRGLWGGIYLLGDDRLIDSDGNLVTLSLNIPGDFETPLDYGGINTITDRDTLNFVSIKYAGHPGAGASPVSLFLGAIDSSAFLDHIDIYNSAGDGIQIQGGYAQIKHLSVDFCAHDGISWNNGYRGKGQYWLVIQDQHVGKSGIKGKGNYSSPIVLNMTLIGSGQMSTNSESIPIHLSSGSKAIIANSIITEFPGYGIRIDRASDSQIADGTLLFQGNIWSNVGNRDSFYVGDKGLIAPLENIDQGPLAQLLNDLNTIIPDIIISIGREKNKMLDPDISNFISLSNSYFTNDPFFALPILCDGPGAFSTLKAWWIKYWSALDQENYQRHPCIVDFLQSQEWRGLSTDTVQLDCSEVDSLLQIETFGCYNDRCFFGNQQLGLVMRMKRKKKRRLDNGDLPFCFVREYEFVGYELFQRNQATEDAFVVDTFKFILTGIITDSTPPVFTFGPCDTCYLPFQVLATDCDTAWVFSEEHDTSSVMEGFITHRYEATDRCGNFNTLNLQESTQESKSTFYFDKDGDGYGDIDHPISWYEILPGFADNGLDCNDQDPNIHPGKKDDPLTLISEDCMTMIELSHCQMSQTLSINETCQYITLDNTNQDLSILPTECPHYISRYSVENWIELIVPNNGQIVIDLERLSESQVKFPEVVVYRGDCNSLEYITCRKFNFLHILRHDPMILFGEPGETLFLQIISGQDFHQGAYLACFTTPSDMFTTTTNGSGNPILVLYPNPVSQDFIQLSKNFAGPGSSYQIVDILGQHTMQGRLDNNETHRINIANLPNGVYHIKIFQELNPMLSSKFVVID